MNDEELRRRFEDISLRLDAIAAADAEERDKNVESIDGLRNGLAEIAEVLQPLRDLVPRSTAVPPDDGHGGVCPYCKEEIHLEATRCKYCQSNLSTPASNWFGGRLLVPDSEGPILLVGQAITPNQHKPTD